MTLSGTSHHLKFFKYRLILRGFLHKTFPSPIQDKKGLTEKQHPQLLSSSTNHEGGYLFWKTFHRPEGWKRVLQIILSFYRPREMQVEEDYSLFLSSS